jgi:phosphatidylglycerol:prolipoprotein diacylglycerol transferase
MIDLLLSQVVWDPSPEVFPGLNIPRWYSLLFAGGFVVSYFIMTNIFRKEGKPESDVDRLTMYMVIGTVLGARLGHVIFYEPERYLSNPIDILKTWEGGLASHGAAIGILLALFYYAKRTKGQSYLWIVDRIVIVAAISACMIRMGNFMNSEIGGKVTDTNYGVVFARDAESLIERRFQVVESVEASKGSSNDQFPAGIIPVDFEIEFKRGNYTEEELSQFLELELKSLFVNSPTLQQDFIQASDQPLNYTIKQNGGIFTALVTTQGIAKHPTQLYEAAAYLGIFFILFGIWNRNKAKLPDGLLFGVFMVFLWSSRFMLEFMKENQVEFEDSMQLNMGQLLSIPLVLVGFFFLVRAYSIHKKTQGTGS